MDSVTLYKPYTCLQVEGRVSWESISDIRVRFYPSSTGTPYVGLTRIALFNWAYARRTGGKLIPRIEDTDVAHDPEEPYQAIIEALSWLGID